MFYCFYAKSGCICSVFNTFNTHVVLIHTSLDLYLKIINFLQNIHLFQIYVFHLVDSNPLSVDRKFYTIRCSISWEFI